MTAQEIEEKKRISALEQEFCEQILQLKQAMYKSGKRFYTCSVGCYQLIVIGTSNEQFVHTIISNLEFINALTN